MPTEGKAAVLTEPELKRVIAVQRSNKFADRNIALIYCSFGLGLRAKELSLLRISDVVDGSGNIKEVVNLTAGHTKGGKQRHVYLTNKKVADAIRTYLDGRNLTGYDAALFLSQKGGRFTPNTMQMLFRRMYGDAGIEGASSHSGRRTFATRLIENGADIKAVSKLMGHSSISMTAQYVEDNPERLKKLTVLAI
ncbi:MAG: site-specific integrase [Cycloclasticus sp.]|nr:site-specific integrase [Cycloclasticus sp.]